MCEIIKKPKPTVIVCKLFFVAFLGIVFQHEIAITAILFELAN